MSDKELIYEFISRLSCGNEKLETIPSNSIFTPVRYANELVHSFGVMANDPLQHGISWSLDKPLSVFTLAKKYPHLPKRRKISSKDCALLMSPVLTRDLLRTLSSAYLYKGYIEGYFLDDFLSYMKKDLRAIKTRWIQFNNHPRWHNSFTFKLPRFLEDLPEPVFELKCLKSKELIKLALHEVSLLTLDEYNFLTEFESEIYRRNAMYYLLLRELFENGV